MNKTTLNSQKEKHSMLSLRRATRAHDGAKNGITISIHALLAESDAQSGTLSRVALISIHALLAESDQVQRFLRRKALAFLSTLSLRRAT